MSTSAIRMDPTAVDASVSDIALHVVMADGRELSVPLVWFPRLLNATPAQRSHWRFIGRGEGLHWPDVDEDVNVESLLRLR
jgi:hypothetical protein